MNKKRSRRNAGLALMLALTVAGCPFASAQEEQPAKEDGAHVLLHARLVLDMTVPDAGVYAPLKLTFTEDLEGEVASADSYALTGNVAIALEQEEETFAKEQYAYRDGDETVFYNLFHEEWTQGEAAAPEAGLMLALEESGYTLTDEVAAWIPRIFGRDFEGKMPDNRQGYHLTSTVSEEGRGVLLSGNEMSDLTIRRSYDCYHIRELSLELSYASPREELSAERQKEKIEESRYRTSLIQTWEEQNSSAQGVLAEDGSAVLQVGSREPWLLAVKPWSADCTVAYQSLDYVDLEDASGRFSFGCDFHTPQAYLKLEKKGQEELHADEEGFALKESTLELNGREFLCLAVVCQGKHYYYLATDFTQENCFTLGIEAKTEDFAKEDIARALNAVTAVKL